jgi:two-component system, NtrC family, response regulator AtoC
MAPSLLIRDAMSVKPEVMVVDDDRLMCEFLTTFLHDRGYGVIALNDAEQAVQHYQARRPAAIILDMVMPGPIDGLGALAEFKKIDREVPVIVLSGQGQTTTVVRAMKLGATDFVNKPFDDADLEVPLAKAIKQRRRPGDTLLSVREQMRSPVLRHTVFNHSGRMAEVFDLIERVADTDVTVLIRGESGTGKELVARAIHASSLRRDKPFLKVNCVALPTELLESELFGFERGAFTGAIQQKPGKFEFANHGTIFLDEIGDMSFPLQGKLLQVLQDGEFSRLGGKHDVRVDVRAVAATNRDLERAVADNQFREDLFFRLNVVSINLPPLRDRKEEIPFLSDYFLEKFASQYNKPVVELARETLEAFMEYDWPGNVRELENTIKRAVVLGTESTIRKEVAIATAANRRRAQAQPIREIAAPPVPPAAIAPPQAAAPSDSGAYSLKRLSRSAAREVERDLILRMLERTRWNRKEAAGFLGISYKALLYKVKEFGLDKAS